MSIRQEFLNEQKNKLLKALVHLNYSYQKILKLPTDPAQMDEEILETWESFAARFSRVADLFLTKYIRAYILMQDPGFNGSFLDFLNQAEKLKLVEQIDPWMSIRELRNISGHEYTEKDLAKFFDRLKQEAPHLLALKKIIEK